MKTGDQEWLTLLSWAYPQLFSVSLYTFFLMHENLECIHSSISEQKLTFTQYIIIYSTFSYTLVKLKDKNIVLDRKIHNLYVKSFFFENKNIFFFLFENKNIFFFLFNFIIFNK